MEADDLGSVDYFFSGLFFLLIYWPLELSDPDVMILSGDIGEVVATVLDVVGGKNLEIFGVDVVGQCLGCGFVDEILVYVLSVLLGDGILFSFLGFIRVDLELVSSVRLGDVIIFWFRVRK